MAKSLLQSLPRVFRTHARFLTKQNVKHSDDRKCVISCRRPSLNHYADTNFSNLDNIPLASKGWNHHKSKGDHFTLNPGTGIYEEASVPLHTLGIDASLIEALKTRNVVAATAYQANAFHLFKEDTHLMLGAETGCGKTLAYLLPIITQLQGRRASAFNSPKALVIVPNRELAAQIGEIAEHLTSAVGLRSKTLIGGRTKRLMMNPEFEEVDLLIGTPGVLGKLSTVGVYKLRDVTYTVLDEADTLTDDSFLDRIPQLIKRVPQSKIILVAATVPKRLPEVLQPIESSLRHVLSPRLHKPLLNVTQKFQRLTQSDKPGHLLQIAKHNRDPMIIFTNRNATCTWLGKFLDANHIGCSSINGDMNFERRVEEWNDFIRGNNLILAATDVASRGLDTTRVRHVLNYDFPVYAADYLHRVGRVGRFNSTGLCKVTNFICGRTDVQLVQEIELAVRSNQPLQNVDGNITSIVQKKIQKGMRSLM